MARTLHNLSDAKAKAARKEGRHSDGGGLYLNVSPSGSKSWLFMWSRGGRRREMGLGAYPGVSLAVARKKAVDCRQLVGQGKDPIAQKARSTELTFGECADRLLEAMETSWKNDKHRAQWRMTLDHYCSPIRGKAVAAIDTEDVLLVLKPIWNEKPETASRLRGRIERVLDFAKARGWRSGENPAMWRGHLKNVLPGRQKLTRGHHAAMPYADVPRFIKKLRKSEALASDALELLILTATRSGECLNATWPEIDWATKVWAIPADRMKAGKEHRVPLTSAAISLLKRLHKDRRSSYIFPGQKEERPLSAASMDMFMSREGAAAYTPHGFRSAFRDWAGDETQFPREIAEAALAHRVGDETERAYRRNDALEKRRELMDAWTSYCGSNGNAKVVRLRRGSK